ncbi:MAG: hypothetical protein JRL30_24165 [Deltaproteobacteria bacterium]|nr:hypothetical protein [Deltaproteobacteria bacterium]
MPKPKAYGRSGHCTARRLLLAADAAHEGDTTPEKVLVVETVHIPHNLQDSRTSVVPPAHERQCPFLGFIKGIFEFYHPDAFRIPDIPDRYSEHISFRPQIQIRIMITGGECPWWE